MFQFIACWTHHPGFTLSGYPASPNSANIYDDLISAQLACFARANCAGVTKVGDNYEMRVGPSLEVSATGDESYIKPVGPFFDVCS